MEFLSASFSEAVAKLSDGSPRVEENKDAFPTRGVSKGSKTDNREKFLDFSFLLIAMQMKG